MSDFSVPSTVLIVDAHPDRLARLSHLLTEAGYDTLAAANFPAAIHLARRFEPRLAIVDGDLAEALPGELARLRQSAMGRGPLPAIVAGGPGRGDGRRPVGAGGQVVSLRRPLAPDVLLDAVDRLLWSECAAGVR